MLKRVEGEVTDRDQGARILALPQPVVPRAESHGGIRYQDLYPDPEGRIEVQMGPIITLVPGDYLELYWGVKPDDPELEQIPPADVYTVKAGDPATLVMLVRAGLIADVWNGGLEGETPVFYRLRDAVTGEWEASGVTPVEVKLDVPGGLDPDPATPENDNLAAPVPAYTDIGEGEAAGGVDVTIEPWLNMAQGDRLTLSWSTQRLPQAPLTPAQVGQNVVVSVPRAVIEAAGDGAGLIVRYQIYDKVQNWSQWSLAALVNVEIDPNLLAAPLVLLAPGGVLDLDQLGTQDVQVMMNDARIRSGDTVKLTWNGQAEEGNPVIETVTGTAAGAFLILNVKNATAKAIAQGLAVVSYTVTPAAGGQALRSKRATVRVIGDVESLKAPEIEEAQEGVVAPARDATVVIEPYAGMAPGDRVELRWTGTTAGGDPTLYTPPPRLITGGSAGQEVRFVIPAEELERLVGGSVQVSYWVYPVGGGGPLESPATGYRVGAVGALLPAPAVAYLDTENGVLDPDRVPASGTTLTVPAGANTQADDEVKVFWRGITGQPSDSYEDAFPVSAGTAGRPLPFDIAKSLVTANLNGEVTVRYEVVRGTQTLYSEQVTFRVGAVSLALPAPMIKEAVGTNLDPVAAKDALTAVVNYADSQPTDEVQVTWTGNGEAGSTQSEWIAVGSVPREVPLDKGVVAFNLGRLVTVSYEVRRNGRPMGTSDLFTLTVQQLDTSPGGPLPTPQLREAVGNELDIRDIVDQGHVRVTPPWPLIAVGQRFWLWLEGTKADGTEHTYRQANGALVTAQHVANGLTGRQVPKSYFDELKDGTTLTLRFKVAFDGTNSEANAVEFPVRTLNVTALEIVRPEIRSVADLSEATDIPSGGFTTETSVRLRGKASVGQSVQILDNGAPKDTVIADGDGNWVYDATDLAVAAHRFTAKGQYGDNPESDPWALTVVATVTPTIASVKDANNVEIPNSGTTTATTVTLSGTASANQRVEIFDGIPPSKGTADVDANGNWTKQLTGLSVGAHSFTAQGLYGNTPTSPARTLTVAAALSFGTNASLNASGYHVSRGHPPYNPPSNASYHRVATGGVPPYTYTSSNQLVATIDNNGFVRAAGNGTATLTVTDGEGTRVTHTVTVSNAKVFFFLVGTLSSMDVCRTICRNNGGRIPTLGELQSLGNTYGGFGTQLPSQLPGYTWHECWTETASGGTNNFYAFYFYEGKPNPGYNWWYGSAMAICVLN